MSRDIAFGIGKLVATPGVIEALSTEDVGQALYRHMTKDWGDLCDEDKASNDAALNEDCPQRLLSSYEGQDNTKFWIITEWDRSVTTILLPNEY